MKLSEVAHGRDNNFNIIRILAALAVLVAHSFPLSGVSTEPLQKSTGMSLGTIAVDVFFITSGFLVSGSLLTRRSILEYLCARGLRIFPALLVMITLSVFGLGVYFTTVSLRSYFTAPETYRYIFKNSTLIAGASYFLPGVFEHNPYHGGVNGSLWSMPHEVRLYAILATIWVALRLVPQQRVRLFKFAIVSCAIVCGAWQIMGHFYNVLGGIFGHPSFRHLSFMFFTGASYYVFKEKVRLSWRLFWVVASVLAVSLVHHDLFFVTYNLVVGYMLLFLAYVPSGLAKEYNLLGDYSYGLYIYAFPVQQALAALIHGIAPWQMMLLATPVALAAAVLSWYLIEKRALRLKSSFVERTKHLVARQSTPIASIRL